MTVDFRLNLIFGDRLVQNFSVYISIYTCSQEHNNITISSNI